MGAPFADVERDINHEIWQYNNPESTYRTFRAKASSRNDHSTYTRLGLIERFVQETLLCEVIPTADELFAHLTIRQTYRTKIASFYPSLDSMRRTYADGYVYSPHVEAFFAACLKLGALEPGFSWKYGLQWDVPGDYDYIVLFRTLLCEIQAHCQSREFLARIEAQRKRACGRVADVLEWEQRLFKWKSRHLFLHITFKYLEQYRDELTPELMQALWQQLLRNRRMNKLLKGIKNFVWRIEEGGQEGVHMHVIIAYDGRSRQDMDIAGAICEYFNEKLTNGKGGAKAENFYKRSIELKGQVDCTGAINSDDIEQREALRIALIYLTKTKQIVKRKAHDRIRTFGMSQVPEHSGLGRPRTTVREDLVQSVR